MSWTPKLSEVSLAIILLDREKDGLLKLTGQQRERHFERLIRMSPMARLSGSGNTATCQRLYELSGSIMGLTAGKVEKAVEEEIKRISQTQGRLLETELVKLFKRQLPAIKVWNSQWYPAK